MRVSAELLAKAQQVTAGGITETVRKGLELLVVSDGYERLRKMRGKMKFSIDLEELREDRR